MLCICFFGSMSSRREWVVKGNVLQKTGRRRVRPGSDSELDEAVGASSTASVLLGDQPTKRRRGSSACAAGAASSSSHKRTSSAPAATASPAPPRKQQRGSGSAAMREGSAQVPAVCDCCMQTSATKRWYITQGVNNELLPIGSQCMECARVHSSSFHYMKWKDFCTRFVVDHKCL